MSARTQKADAIVIGGGLAATAAARFLARAGRTVTLILESEGLPPPLADFPALHRLPQRRDLAAAGLTLLAAEGAGVGWAPLAARVVGPPLPDSATELPGALVDQPALMAAWRDEVRAAGGRVVATRVRGLSIIEGVVLGAITEAGRWDAPLLLNASDDERAIALGRMARESFDLALLPVPLSHCPTLASDGARATAGGALAWPDGRTGSFVVGESSLLFPEGTHCVARDMVARSPLDRPLLLGAGSARGAWRLLGTAGWPLLALGAAHWLAQACAP